MSTKYIICTTARSGSNLLCNYLTNTRLLGHPHEYLNTDVIRHQLNAGYTPDDEVIPLQNYLEWVQRRYSTPNGVFGIKILFDQFENFYRSEAVRSLFKGARLIHLTREDKVQQAVSYYLAQETGAWTHNDKPRTPASKVEYSFERLLSRYMSLTMRDSLWAHFLSENELTALQLTYEGFLDEPESSINAILNYLDVKERPLKIETSMRSQHSDINEDFCARFAEDLKFRLGGPTGQIVTIGSLKFGT